MDMIFINARSIYTDLSIKRPFSTWFYDKKNKHKLRENEDFMVFSTREKNGVLYEENKVGRPRKEYLLTMDTVNLITKGNMKVQVSIKSEKKKKEVLRLLKNWSNIEVEKLDIQESIDQLEEEVSAVISVQAVSSGGSIREGGISDPTYRKAVQIEEINKHKGIYMARFEEITEQYFKLDKAMFELEFIERNILKLRYLENLQWYNIARNIKESETNCKRLGSEALENLVKIF